MKAVEERKGRESPEPEPIKAPGCCCCSGSTQEQIDLFVSKHCPIDLTLLYGSELSQRLEICFKKTFSSHTG